MTVLAAEGHLGHLSLSSAPGGVLVGPLEKVAVGASVELPALVLPLLLHRQLRDQVAGVAVGAADDEDRVQAGDRFRLGLGARGGRRRRRWGGITTSFRRRRLGGVFVGPLEEVAMVAGVKLAALVRAVLLHDEFVEGAVALFAVDAGRRVMMGFLGSAGVGGSVGSGRSGLVVPLEEVAAVALPKILPCEREWKARRELAI